MLVEYDDIHTTINRTPIISHPQLYLLMFNLFAQMY